MRVATGALQPWHGSGRRELAEVAASSAAAATSNNLFSASAVSFASRFMFAVATYEKIDSFATGALPLAVPVVPETCFATSARGVEHSSLVLQDVQWFL